MAVGLNTAMASAGINMLRATGVSAEDAARTMRTMGRVVSGDYPDHEPVASELRPEIGRVTERCGDVDTTDEIPIDIPVDITAPAPVTLPRDYGCHVDTSHTVPQFNLQPTSEGATVEYMAPAPSGFSGPILDICPKCGHERQGGMCTYTGCAEVGVTKTEEDMPWKGGESLRVQDSRVVQPVESRLDRAIEMLEEATDPKTSQTQKDEAVKKALAFLKGE